MQYTRPASVADMLYLAENLRAADVAEVGALGYSPVVALLTGYKTSSICNVMTPVDSDKPVGVYGVCPSPHPEVGIIWMLATPELEKHQIKFLRRCRQAIAELFGDFKILHNFTDARNTVHHRWLNWCGAVALRKVPLGTQGEDFFEFVIRKQ